MAAIVSLNDDKIIMVEVPTKFDAESAETIFEKLKFWFDKSVEVYGFNFQNTVEIKSNCYRGFLNFSQQARKTGKVIASFHVNKLLEKQLTTEGLTIAFNVVHDYDKYMSTFIKTPAPQLDVRLVNPFLDATIKTLEMQAQVKCEAQKLQMVNLNEKPVDQDFAIAGVIALNTDKFSGSITLAFPEKVFLGIYGSMVGETVTKLTPEIEDAAGELLNIIYGTAKTKITETTEYKLNPVLPTVLSGEKLKIRQKTFQKIILLPFKTQFGMFQVEISFDFQNR